MVAGGPLGVGAWEAGGVGWAPAHKGEQSVGAVRGGAGWDVDGGARGARGELCVRQGGDGCAVDAGRVVSGVFGGAGGGGVPRKAGDGAVRVVDPAGGDSGDHRPDRAAVLGPLPAAHQAVGARE